jgi:hypothetical protein
VKLREPAQRAEQSATPAGRTSEAGGESVWEQVCKRKNLFRALKRVEANGGAPGVDGMTVEALRPYLKAHPGPGRQPALGARAEGTGWLELKAAPWTAPGLDAGTYRPSPVRRVEIPKPDGGVRLLGIPAVMDPSSKRRSRRC